MARLTADQKAANKAKRDATNAARREAGLPTEVEALNQAAMQRPDMVRAETVKVQRDSETVIVACKVALPYIDLRLFREEMVMENTQTGPRQVKEYRANGETFRIRGTAYPRGTPPAGFPDRPRMADGAALTPNCPRKFWDIWVEQNERNPLYHNGLIFAHAHIDDVRAQARELKDLKSGLEPIDPTKANKDPRVPRPTNAGLTAIETEEGRAKNDRQQSAVAESFEDTDV